MGHIASTASNSFGSGAAAGQTANATMTALGYDQVRRDLARKLHVDPYSSDPVLTKKLNSVAWVMFSARLTVDAAMMAVPGLDHHFGRGVHQRPGLRETERGPHYVRSE